MMSRWTLILSSPEIREKAVRWINAAPHGMRVEFKAPRRSVPQNDRMWAMLTDLSEQVVWHGQKLTPTDWKDVMTAGLKRELRVVPAIDGRGFVQIGLKTSDMSKAEHGALMDLIEAFGAQHGVVFHGASE